ncbi:MAG: DHH family phosphoesterase [Gemmataceae bacterium]|nr:DHH family phosphoesterase [Gemmataceae bacterium]
MPRQSADSGVNGRVLTPRCSDRFLASVQDASRITFVSHVQPDPDSLGSMMGLAHLVETCLGKPTRLTQDGLITRAENRAMVDLLDLDLVPIDGIDWRPCEAIVMVDSQPNTGRHTFDPDIPITAVIDHHQTPGDLEGIPFTDIRRGLGATCSVVTSYLMEQELPIPPRMATGLAYGIETELSGYPREASPIDDGALYFLFPLTDKDLLAQIRNAPLPQAYYECVLQALQSSFIYNKLIISWVNELHQPEMAAQIVDFLIRFDEIEWAVCAGVYEEKLILSVRTSVPRAQAGEMLRQVVGKMGRAGGHDRRAGGFVNLPSTAASAIEQTQAELRRRLLKALHIEECRGQRLVSRREMLQNIQA